MSKDWTMVWVILDFTTSYVEKGAETKPDFYVDKKKEHLVNHAYIVHVTPNFPQLVPKWLYEQFVDKGGVRIIKDIKAFIKGDPKFDEECGDIWKSQFFSYVDPKDRRIYQAYSPEAIQKEIDRIKAILKELEKKKAKPKTTAKKTTAKKTTAKKTVVEKPALIKPGE